MTGSTQPTLRTKLAFWVVLGMVSTAFAEVTTGSYLLPFVTPWGVLVVVPLYTLHATAALWAVYRYGRPRFATMYLLGVLFGFYEFFITKVLWVPPWGSSVSVGGIDLWAFVVLTLFFHPLASWMLAAAATERATLASTDAAAALPPRLARPPRWVALVVLVAVSAGLGANGGPVVAPVSMLSTVGGLLLVSWWWRRDPRRTGLRLEDLAPTGRQAVGLLSGLGAFYVLATAVLRPEALPPAPTVLFTFVLYGVVVALFSVAARRSRSDPAPRWPGPPGWWPPPARMTVGLSLVAMIGGLAGGAAIANLYVAAVWLIAVSGIGFLWRAARYAARGVPEDASWTTAGERPTVSFPRSDRGGDHGPPNA